MKYFLSVFLITVLSYSAKSQIVLSDTVHCTDVTLHAAVTGITPINSMLYSDDSYSGVLPIGFTFNFYGTPNTQFIIGENGTVCFDIGLAGGGIPWSITAPLLGNSAVFNSVCGPWCDIDGAYSTIPQPIYYSTQGIAPNRTLAVTWCGVDMYSCWTQWTTTQIILYESTNIAEVHIGHKSICATWNGGYAICGVQNAAGTAATAAPGRDYPSVWAATDEAWRFTPVGTTGFTASSIPYAPIPYSTSIVYWYDSTTGAYLGMGPSLTVTPVAGTTYEAAVAGCSDTTVSYIHIDPITILSGGGIPHIDTNVGGVTYTDPTICGECDGSITLHGVNPHQADSVYYIVGGVAHPAYIDSAGLDSTIHINDLCAGFYTGIYVKVGTCPSNVVGPITLTNPPVNIGLNYSIDMGCNGDNVTFTNLSAPTGPAFVSAWDFGDSTAVSALINPSHIYLNQGTHNVHFTYSTTFGCSVDTTFSILHTHPLTDSFTSDYNAVCVGMPIQFTNASTSFTNGTSTSGLLTYLWDYGTGATDTAANPSYTYGIPGIYYPKLTITDTIGCQQTKSEKVEVIFIDVSAGVHDTSVCLLDSMVMRAYVRVIPDTVPFTYIWTPVSYLGQDTILTTTLQQSSYLTANFFAVGSYVYTITVTTSPMLSNAIGCQATDTQRIMSYPPVTFTNLTVSPQIIQYGSSVQLNANGAVSYVWTPDNGTLNNPNISDPIATPTDSTTVYTVSGMNEFGCRASANIVVSLDYNAASGMPTGFTPNGDGINDIFRLTKLKYQKLVEFIVYNRWGQEVFKTSNPEVGWDGNFNGTPQDIGVYNYVIIVSMPEGYDKTYKGTVTLIR